MYNHIYYIRVAIILLSSTLLSGCLGGTVAQQIVRSIATSVADKTVARAMDVDEKPASTNDQRSVNTLLLNSAPDPYRDAMLNMEFKTIKVVQEPLPDYPAEEEAPVVTLQTNPLVQVELFNLLIGDEKNTVLENAYTKGALNLPPPLAWKNWRVGTGLIKSPNAATQKLITFLIPPEFGKLPSGSITMVELANTNDINIARYLAR